jgi:parafibromin
LFVGFGVFPDGRLFVVNSAVSVMPPKSAAAAAEASRKRGRDSWAALVDTVAATPAGPSADLADWKIETALPAAASAKEQDDRAAFVAASKADLAPLVGAVFVAQMTDLEALHAQPDASHETDVFVAGKGLTDNTAVNAKARALENESATHVGRADDDCAAAVSRVLTQGAVRIQASREGKLPSLSLAPQVSSRLPDFQPIILVPGAASSIVQIGNVLKLVQEGQYVEGHKAWINGETGATLQQGLDKSVAVSPGPLLPNIERFNTAFRHFRVVSDPKEVGDWRHVCAAFVLPAAWQFDSWFGGDKAKQAPGELFNHVCGFLPYFEEDRIPKQLKDWRVTPLLMSRKATKQYAMIRVACIFWEELYKFLDTHAFFRTYKEVA